MSFRRRAALVAGLGGVAPLGSAWSAERSPSECIVPAKAGGGFDLTCKAAQLLLAEFRPLQLRYVPGGIGALAYTTVITKRPSDASAIIAFSSGSLLNLAQGKFGPHTEADVRWLAIVSMDHGVIAVRKDSPYRNLKDLLEVLRTQPRAVTFGAGGTLGSQDWFKVALLARAVGVSHRSLRFVAFEGGGDALTALEGGHVAVFAGDAAEVSRHNAQGGAVRVLSVLSERRLPREFANVPTAREAGVDLVWPIARGFYMGPQVPDAAFREWTELIRRSMALPQVQAQVQAQLAALSLSPHVLVGDEVQAFVKRSVAEYRALAKQFDLLRE